MNWLLLYLAVVAVVLFVALCMCRSGHNEDVTRKKAMDDYLKEKKMTVCKKCSRIITFVSNHKQRRIPVDKKVVIWEGGKIPEGKRFLTQQGENVNEGDLVAIGIILFVPHSETCNGKSK